MPRGSVCRGCSRSLVPSLGNWTTIIYSHVSASPCISFLKCHPDTVHIKVRNSVHVCATGFWHESGI